jgi:hypothetical protein
MQARNLFALPIVSPGMRTSNYRNSDRRAISLAARAGLIVRDFACDETNRALRRAGAVNMECAWPVLNENAATLRRERHTLS